MLLMALFTWLQRSGIYGFKYFVIVLASFGVWWVFTPDTDIPWPAKTRPVLAALYTSALLFFAAAVTPWRYPTSSPYWWLVVPTVGALLLARWIRSRALPQARR
jgi:hypothetical protein